MFPSMDSADYATRKKRFLLLMSGIAIAMITSWILIKNVVGFDQFDGIPLGLVLILADLGAFVVIGIVLKKRFGL